MEECKRAHLVDQSKKNEEKSLYRSQHLHGLRHQPHTDVVCVCVRACVWGRVYTHMHTYIHVPRRRLVPSHPNPTLLLLTLPPTALLRRHPPPLPPPALFYRPLPPHLEQQPRR